MKFNVITSLARFGNLPKLIESLRPHNISWHIITDSDSGYKHDLNENWINHYECPNEGFDFWVRCHNSINWFLSTQTVIEDEYYCILNDDDAYEDNFFEKIKYLIQIHNDNSDILICSMMRGHRTPTDVPSVSHHPTDTLIAHPSNIRVSGVGLEQFIAKGKSVKFQKIPLTPCGDGEFIVHLVENNSTSYLPDCFIKFNYFQPGRWDY